jgi:hypothetical protein
MVPATLESDRTFVGYYRYVVVVDVVVTVRNA